MNAIRGLIRKIMGLSRRTKIILVVVLLVLVFLVLRGRNKPVVLDYATVTRDNIASQISASGSLSGKKAISLHFNMAGKLNYLPLSSGATVAKGQVIASLDTTQLNAAYQQALNNRRSTQATVDSIHDQLKDHSGDETFAQKATRTAAEAANDSAYDAVVSTQRALKDAVLVSPISGIVVARNNLSVGQNITPSDVIAQVVDFSEKDFEATIDEADIGQIHIGQDAEVTLNAYGDSVFKGKVVEIEPATQTDTTGAITVTVKIQLTDEGIQNIFGLNGNANVITASKSGVLLIPQDALIDETHVYVKLANGKPEKKQITTGIKSDVNVEVTSGLSEGEQVVTNPQAVK